MKEYEREIILRKDYEVILAREIMAYSIHTGRATKNMSIEDIKHLLLKIFTRSVIEEAEKELKGKLI